MKNAIAQFAAADIATAVAAAPAEVTKKLGNKIGQKATAAKTETVAEFVGPVAPVAEKKGRATRPAQEKKATTAPAASVVVASASAIKYIVNPQFRAAQGNRLFSHTEAVLQLLGMYEKGTMKREELDDIFGGKTTVSYHMKKGRFLEGKKGFGLSTEGKAWFAARGTSGNAIRFDMADVEAYKEILTTGKDSSGRIIGEKAPAWAVKAIAA